MSGAWIPLRQQLRAELEPQLDAVILNDPDAATRAWFARHKERVLKLCIDQIELGMLRKILAEREEHAQHSELKRPNGSPKLQALQ